MTREEAARAFAKKVRWPECDVTDGRLRFTTSGIRGRHSEDCLYLPAPDATLHEHLAFVGRVAEAIDCVRYLSVEAWTEYPIHCRTGVLEWRVSMCDRSDPRGITFARPDLSHAALLAALAALEER